MATLKQITANRENAKKSTGPRTPNGIRASSQNARKTGVYAKHGLLPEESEDSFAQLHADYYRDCIPVGPTEILMVERLVALAWRMARFPRAEAGMIDGLRRLAKGIGGTGAAYLHNAISGDPLGRIVSMEASTFKAYVATMADLKKIQQARKERDGLPVKSPTSAE